MNATTKAKRAVLYLRVSDRGQVENDYDPEGNSIPAQRAACTRKAEELGFEIVDEYVEPGRSATNTDRRPKFLEMMARVRNRSDVDAIIVYARSRMHRDSTDAAITRKELRRLGVQLISIMDYTEDTYVGDLVAAILDGVNEYQSRASGADVSYKMAAKAANGGTNGQAPLGYRNVGEKVDGREVRTVVLDEERAPLVKLMFELYATGTHSYRDLQRIVTEAGLRTRSTKKLPAGREITLYVIGRILRDRYYLGRIVFKGKEYPGRHEALISQELFDRVQDVLANQRGAGTRERIYSHPLKGVLYCGHCRTRFYLDRGKSRRGILYFYFLCSGRSQKRCPVPRIPVAKVEAAVRAHYATLAIPEDVAANLRAALDSAVRDRLQHGQAMRRQLQSERDRLVEQQDQLIELVGNADWPQDRLEVKMRDLRDRIGGINEQLSRAGTDDVTRAVESLESLMAILEDPRALLENTSEERQRSLHSALFKRLYLHAEEDDRVPEVVADEVLSPVSPLFPALRVFSPRWECDAPGKEKNPGPVFPARGSDSSSVAPQLGLEPRTCRLTVGCSAN